MSRPGKYGIVPAFADGKYRPFNAEQRAWVGESHARLSENWRRLVDPVFFDFEKAPATGPSLWVGNHSLYAFADMGLLLAEAYRCKGIVLRGLGDHIHFKIPVWRTLMGSYGAIDGTRENCRTAMQAGDHLLVFPGGGYEVMKRNADKHRLLWKQRTGFARLAIENDCPIVPFAAVGADDCWDVVPERSFLRDTAPGRWLLQRAGIRPEKIPPLVKGIGPTPLPRPERIYFKVFSPVSPRAYRELPPEEGAMSLRSEVERIVQGGLDELLEYRERDPLRSFTARMRKSLVPQEAPL